MKVLHILDTVERGGIEMLELDVCRNAARNGLDLIFAHCGGGSLAAEFAASGTPVHYLNRRLPLDPLLVLGLRRLIKDENVDIVHSHLAVAGVHGYLASLGTNAKNVFTFHGFYDSAKERHAASFLIPRMAKNIACSNGLLEWLRDEQAVDINRNFSVLYNGVDPKRLEYNGEDLRAELGLPAGSILFGMVANFYAAARKDQLTLCRAFADAANELPHAHLILVGSVEAGAESKYQQCLALCREEGIVDRVHFLGRRGDMQKVLSSLDICVMSSLHEGLPIALIEAMLAKKACILSDIPPHIEASNNGDYAELFETKNAVQLAKKMVKLAKDGKLRAELAERAYLYATDQFSIDAHLRELSKLYASLIR